MWHLQNGVLDVLNPKVWVIVVGNNDLYETKCTDRFVLANILNVIKAISEAKPGAILLIHGIMPRLDSADEKKGLFLGESWKRANSINTQIRQFIKKGQRGSMRYVNGGIKFLSQTGKDTRGRKQINPAFMASGGRVPTVQGMEVWSDFMAIKIRETIQLVRTTGKEDEEAT